MNLYVIVFVYAVKWWANYSETWWLRYLWTKDQSVEFCCSLMGLNPLGGVEDQNMHIVRCNAFTVASCGRGLFKIKSYCLWRLWSIANLRIIRKGSSTLVDNFLYVCNFHERFNTQMKLRIFHYLCKWTNSSVFSFLYRKCKKFSKYPNFQMFSLSDVMKWSCLWCQLQRWW